MPAPAADDEEGIRLDPGLPPVIDAHVHLFPDRLFEAIWRWFEEYGWPIRYDLYTPDVLGFLLARGVSRVVALCYAHKPGIARGLNQWMAEICAAHPQVTGLGTVFPGENDAVGIVEEAIAAGLEGIKLHCHVQRMGPDDPKLHDVYETLARRGKVLVIHAGREPSSPAYGVDTHTLCGAGRLERVLRDHPTLKVVVPHLGFDELEPYRQLVERYDTLWLDTTMVLADYFEVSGWSRSAMRRFLETRPDRILYGTDFPNLPYAWDREVRQITAMQLRDHHLGALLGGVAADLYGL